MDPDGARPASTGAAAVPRRRRGPRLGSGGEGRRALLIAAVSSAVVFGGLALVAVNAPGWPRFRESFLNGPIFWEALPRIVAKFWVNVGLFGIAEVLILALGLVLAVLRSLPGPVFFPVRLLATIYVDVFRALPGLLVIFVLGLGIPALRIEGLPRDPFIFGVLALTLLYSAYVSEVYRAGIESVHPSQEAAARSLGLSRWQSMRFVILPQAVRRVIPPLLNDFIGLQKDTVLVSSIGLVEIFRQTQIVQAAKFNFTPYLATALVFLVITIPMARLTDWLLRREKDRRVGGGTRILMNNPGSRGVGGVGP